MKIDFRDVQVIVIDEYSMVSLVSLAYLNKVLREVFPEKQDIIFSGIPVIISGDGFQLPVVKSQGILTKNSSRISPYLREVYESFTHEVFYLQLTKSIRQENDVSFFDTLMRMRHAKSTQNDIKFLNERFITNLPRNEIENINWKIAPVLAGKKKTVEVVNDKSIETNAKNLGAFCIHSLPILKGTENFEEKQKILKNHLIRTQNRTNEDQFKPAGKLFVYPGMPVMLRTNICPALGLSNGSLGNIVAVLNNYIPPLESKEDLLTRFTSETEINAFVPSVLVDFGKFYKGKIGALDSKNDLSQNNIVLIEPQSFGKIHGLPLTPAHSMTIHKSQSLTIPYCKIDPSDPFASGQIYVAFSRAPSHNRIMLLKKISMKEVNKFRKDAERIEMKLENINLNSSNKNIFNNFMKQVEDEIEDQIPLSE